MTISLVMRPKGESQNGGYKETEHANSPKSGCRVGA